MGDLGRRSDENEHDKGEDDQRWKTGLGEGHP